jgi:hypothetical protein
MFVNTKFIKYYTYLKEKSRQFNGCFKKTLYVEKNLWYRVCYISET